MISSFNMDTVCKVTVVVTWVMYLELQGCSTCVNPDIQDSVAPKEALLIGPDGVTECILIPHPSFVMKISYVHRDENGECICSFCRAGQHVESFCVCEQDSNLPKTDTICDLVEIGQYMDQANFCLEAYNCTASCAENQTIAKNCSFGADIQCQCKEGWYNPNKKDTGIPKDCLKKPSCPNAGEKPLENDGEKNRTFSCKRCRDGHFKKEGDVDCKPHRVCQTKAGDQFEDTECLNDIPSVSESPGNTASSVTQDSASEATTESASQGVSQATTESASQGVSQTTVPTDSGTESDTCSCVVAWSISIFVFICLLGVIFLCYEQHKRFQNELKKLTDNPAQRVVFLPGSGGAPGNVRMGGDD